MRTASTSAPPGAPLALRLAATVAALDIGDLEPAVAAKAATCLQDLIGCACESLDQPVARQALRVAASMDPGHPGAATVIGAGASTLCDAAFVNGVLGHGLVREDMHSASISHLGMVVLPAVLALAQQGRAAHGRDLLAAIVAGYEVGARIGAALMDSQLARVRRPTGITGPLAAAAAGARLLRLDATRTAHALALAANTTAGLNQWGHTGGSEMYFHAGFAARSGVTAVLLAQAGAFASPTALDGEAGLFAAYGKRAAAEGVRLFDGAPEILAVYHKPVPACNFAQTPAQAALRLARELGAAAERIAAVTVRVPLAGARYPGCDYCGPFEHVLQAKMSIQYNVAAALLTGGVTEANFALLADARLARLLERIRLEVDETMTRAYPGRQGGAIEVVLGDGTRHAAHLDDVVHASAQEVHARFLAAASQRLGPARAEAIAQRIDVLADCEDAACLPAALGASTTARRASSQEALG